MPKQDPLDLLRNAYLQSQKKPPIKLKGTDLYFGRQTKLPVDTETAWQSTQTGKQYNLGSLWLILELHLQRIPNKAEYFRQVSALKVDAIGVADADQIVKYFTGETNQTQCINSQLKLALSQRAKGRDKSATGQNQCEDKIQKKIKTEVKLDEESLHLIKCIDYLNTFQKPISSKFRILRYPQRKFINILTNLIQTQNQNSQPKPNESQTGKYRIAHIYQKKRLPIIIVPEKTIPGNVSIQNIQPFLTKGQYHETAKLHNPEISKIQVQKVLRNRSIVFEVYSRPELLSEKDWEYVIAIFVVGKDSQFQQWPYKNHKKVFQNALGYFVKYPKSLVGSVAQWKCQIKIVEPYNRAGDGEIVKSIWDEIEKFIFTKI